jgi:hypothetical protein
MKNFLLSKFLDKFGFNKRERIAITIIATLFIFFVAFKFIFSLKNFNKEATLTGLHSLRTAINLYYGEHNAAFPDADIAEKLVKNGYLNEIPYNYIGQKSNEISTTAFDGALNMGGWVYKTPGSAEFPSRADGAIWANSSKNYSDDKLWSDL